MLLNIDHEVAVNGGRLPVDPVHGIVRGVFTRTADYERICEHASSYYDITVCIKR